MLLSMTGFGNASGQNERFTAAAEIKAVNNRYLKVSTRFPDVLASLEPEFERLIRESIARGTVSLNLRFAPVGQGSRYHIVPEVVAAYSHQLRQIGVQQSLPVPEWSDAILSLPGVVADELGSTVDPEVEWPLLEQTIREAIERLQEFRQREGEAMQRDLTLNCDIISERVGKIAERAPDVVSAYRDKVLDRVSEMLKGSGASVQPNDLIREVSVFADRCDINEEITRLRCHVEEFRKVMDAPQSQGRKLDFLSQEMFREINTTGSKASNVEIAHHVVEMKAAVEKIREVLQNVE
ncbi:YicC family protein [bacterium]|nr:YicC family protein [bacterium]